MDNFNRQNLVNNENKCKVKQTSRIMSGWGNDMKIIAGRHFWKRSTRSTCPRLDDTVKNKLSYFKFQYTSGRSQQPLLQLIPSIFIPSSFIYMWVMCLCVTLCLILSYGRYLNYVCGTYCEDHIMAFWQNVIALKHYNL